MTEFLYDEDYYKNHLGPIPCSFESKEWTGFFDKVAQEIVFRYMPEFVIDAGCGIGLLVKSLSDFGVIAMGFDGSEYAVGVAYEHDLLYRIFLLDLRYAGFYADENEADLVTCIEVIEHIEEKYADECIKNLCKMSKKYIVFSSSPDDHEEPSHVNVQEEKYWLALFEKYGFRYLEPATYIAPHSFVLIKNAGN